MQPGPSFSPELGWDRGLDGGLPDHCAQGGPSLCGQQSPRPKISAENEQNNPSFKSTALVRDGV